MITQGYYKPCNTFSLIDSVCTKAVIQRTQFLNVLLIPSCPNDY